MKIGQGMASKVYANNGVVKKVYYTDKSKYNKRGLDKHWKKEIHALKTLKGKKHFPQLIDVNEKLKIIWMTNCGEKITKDNVPTNWEKQCDTIDGSMHTTKLFHCDLMLKNITVKDGIIYIVDWGLWSDEKRDEIKTVKQAIKKLWD